MENEQANSYQNLNMILVLSIEEIERNLNTLNLISVHKRITQYVVHKDTKVFFCDAL